MREYFCMAFGFYIGALLVNWRSFKGAVFVNVLHGILGALLFPLTALVLIAAPDQTKDGRG